MSPEVTRTTCVLDCPDTCALEVSVEDGKVAAIRGASAHPVTQGFICSKVTGFPKRLYHADRVLYPLRRRGAKGSGGFERISWEEAIDEITRRFREIRDRWGGEAILPFHYGGSNGFLTDEFLDTAYFARLGASRLSKTICAAPTGAVATGMYGKMPGVAFEDYVHARFILIWGANPRASNIHLVPFLKEAKRRGAFIATVDPARTFSSDLVDLHVPVYPGADLTIALALIRIWWKSGCLDEKFLAAHADGLATLLEKADPWTPERAAAEARVSVASLGALAEAYRSRSPALLRCGWGLERNANGGHAVAAVLAAPALLGKFGVRGGGYTLSNSGAVRLDVERVLGPIVWKTREINMTQLGEVLTGRLAPPIKALFVYNCNPVATVPDQNAVIRGFLREDLFTVVHEQVMTDSARYADIVLPATTFLEHHDVRRGYGNYVVGGVKPVIPPREEARPNYEVFAALGRAMGWEDEVFSKGASYFVEKIAAALSRPVEAARLAAGELAPVEFSGGTPLQFETVHPGTPDGKIHLTPEALGKNPYRYTPVRSDRFPLALVSPASARLVTSTFGESNCPELRVTLHPKDARTRGVRDGDLVRVFNDLGEVHCRAEWSDRIAEGVASMPKGAWMKSSVNGRTATALCPADVSDVGGGACFMDARVEVERI